MTPVQRTRAALVFDYVAAHPDGVTVPDMARALNLPRSAIYQAIQDVRMTLGESPNLIPHPVGQRRPWIYRFEEQILAARPWLSRQFGEVETKLATMGAVAASYEAIADDPIEAQRARVVRRGVERIAEDLADLAS